MNKILIAAMSVLISTGAAQANTDTWNADSSVWAPSLDKCYRGNLWYDHVCVQDAVLSKGMANRFGEACFDPAQMQESGLMPKQQINDLLQFLKTKACTPNTISYDAGLQQCVRQGINTCGRLSASRTPAAPTSSTSTNAYSNTQTTRPAPQPSSAKEQQSVGGIFDTVNDAAGTINKIKGLFD